MALVFRESFAASTNPTDYVTYQKMNTFNTNVGTFSFVAGAFNDPGLVMSGGGNGSDPYCVYNFTNNSQWTVGLRMFLNNGSASNRYGQLSWSDINGVTQLYVLFNSFTGVISAYNGNNTLLGQSVSGLVPNLLWKYYEIQASIGTSTGSVWVRAGGTSGTVALNLTNVNTQASALANSTQMSIINHSSVLTFQHMIFMDNTTSVNNGPIGDVRVVGFFPIANSTPLQFTANGTNANWRNVSMVPPNPNTYYNAANTTGNQDTFTMNGTAVLTQPPGTITTVYDVAVTTLAAKTDASARTLENVIISGGVQSNSAQYNLLVSPSYYTVGFATDPATTNSVWTLANAIAATAGYKIGV